MGLIIAEQDFVYMLLLFWILLYILGQLFRVEKRRLRILPGFLMYRSKNMKKLLDLVSQQWHNLWKTLSNIGLALAFGLMVLGTYFLVDSVLKFAYAPRVASPMILPLLPGITIRPYWLPYFFVSLAIVAITHELAHGVAARSEGIPVKSAGLFLAFVFFGGFVEMDKKEFEGSSIVSKVRILCAGSSTNLLTAFLIILLMTNLYAPPAGILIQEVIENGPVDKVGLQRWDVIYGINGSLMLTSQAFRNYMVNVTSGQTLILETNVGNKTIATRALGERAIIGIQAANFQPCRLPLNHLNSLHLYWTLNWTLIIALSVAVFNMLPIYFLDGERLVYYTLKKVVKKRLREARILVNTTFFGLLATNVILSFMKYGLVSI